MLLESKEKTSINSRNGKKIDLDIFSVQHHNYIKSFITNLSVAITQNHNNITQFDVKQRSVKRSVYLRLKIIHLLSPKFITIIGPQDLQSYC